MLFPPPGVTLRTPRPPLRYYTGGMKKDRGGNMIQKGFLYAISPPSQVWKKTGGEISYKKAFCMLFPPLPVGGNIILKELINTISPANVTIHTQYPTLCSAFFRRMDEKRRWGEIRYEKRFCLLFPPTAWGAEFQRILSLTNASREEI